MVYRRLTKNIPPAKDKTSARRGSKIYSRNRWTKASNRYRLKRAECEVLYDKDIIVPSDVVDHILPERFWPSLFWNEENWQALSRSIHQRKSQLESKCKTKQDWLKVFNHGIHRYIRSSFDIKILIADEL